MSVCIIHCDAFRHGKIICNQADICVRINLKGVEGWKNWLLVCIICVGGRLRAGLDTSRPDRFFR